MVGRIAAFSLVVATSFSAHAAVNADVRRIGGASWSGETKGPVKRVTVERSEFSFPLGVPVPQEASRTLVEEYDREGRIERRTNQYRYGQSSGFSMTEYVYDAVGRVIEEVNSSENSPRSHVVRHIYDADGNRSETVYVNSRNEPMTRRLFSYDRQGRLVADLYHTQDGTLRATTEYAYADTDGPANDKPIEVGYFDEHGELRQRTTYTYTDAGEVASTTLQDANGAVQSTSTYTYGKNGDLVSSTNKGPWGKTVSRYNEHGDVVEVVMRDPKGNLLVKAVRLYAYDEHGNWTQIRDMRTSLIVGDRLVMMPYEIVNRTIEYYEDEAAESKAEGSQ